MKKIFAESKTMLFISLVLLLFLSLYKEIDGINIKNFIILLFPFCIIMHFAIRLIIERKRFLDISYNALGVAASVFIFYGTSAIIEESLRISLLALLLLFYSFGIIVLCQINKIKKSYEKNQTQN